MIVRHFLQWIQTAPAQARAEATSALARSFLYSDLTLDDRAAAQGAMVMLLDDPSPLVRRALAEALASSDKAPLAVILGLAQDQAEIAHIVVANSPLIADADLVDCIGSQNEGTQIAIARRIDLSCAVSAAIAEVGSADACLALIQNDTALIAVGSLDRLVERFGHVAAIREALLPRPNLPASTRQMLVSQLSETLSRFCALQNWLREDRAEKITRDACEKATVALAATAPRDDVRPLVTHLRDSGQLTGALVLRSLLSGNITLFEETLAELSGMPLARVSGLVHDRSRRGLNALFERAQLPFVLYPAIVAAIEALNEASLEPGGAVRLKRRMTERVLTACAPLAGNAEMEPLLAMLRRFATEAARDEARMFCQDLVAA
ncbi:hypothetical protein GJW-30_1_02733 [Variibacter gotjawalensis]|uniref:DUF2336 domain-containing protein n=1 Tax=Variibacter gotjawalensis TaxID=1333996 RepID=A0A0S3PW86_9BRAD|nr:DUF2336 domain-containing protein [Variibacter gotjawalensis]NIK46023.1 uncharacterized protein (DUF2336 family) [Variibacter gotjawalensis]RZS47941.1 uncharacterized protein (DUF2336 family) [Variibacter gotjawalensis]BAT60197.1 hypothetical protein GJW-30_1_02733 [Variibacter gotjawalensis]